MGYVSGDTMNDITNSFAAGSGVVIARQSVGARSGDLARAFPHRDGRALLFIGDVSGHDDRAANLAGELEARVTGMARWMSPGSLLSELNSFLEATSDSDVFVTAICLSLDARSGVGTIAVAGHLPPIIKGMRSTRVLDADGGPPLGVLAGKRYRERDFALGHDEMLVAVTDGVTDPLATKVDLLGLAALVEIVARAPLSPERACLSLLQTAKGFGWPDDATVLAVGRRPYQVPAFQSQTLRPLRLAA
jgi:serine phosphatase RsbU (regulator of sigma subunit)